MASNTNRAIITKVVLGNGKILIGKSVNGFDLKGKKFPLVYGKSAALSASQAKCAEGCDPSCIDASLVKGKILVCDKFHPYVPYSKGAVATILEDNVDYSETFGIHMSGLTKDDYDSLLSYINSTKSPEATVLKSETIFNQKAPKVISFSSRGPSILVPDILKPDITAPGVDILASYSLNALPFWDNTRVRYYVQSGTSMSCPHVAGIAAYVKTFHPEWSPSMIKSAIMTTAWPMNASETGYASTEFAYGSGHVDPIAATNPGLVYDSTKEDYIAFLCGMNYNSTRVKLISGEAVTCNNKENLPRNLNYPSMSAKFLVSNSSFTVTFKRTVTNVGVPNSTYKSKVVLAYGSKLNVKVSPSVLSMKSMNEKQSFTVTVTGSELDSKLPSSANLIWSDGIHNVRSPIVIYAGLFPR